MKIFIAITCLLVVFYVLFVMFNNMNNTITTDTLGCSVPKFVDLVFDTLFFRGFDQWKQDFNKACVRHDLCYRAGSCTYGRDRRYCDAEFRNNLNQQCQNYDLDSKEYKICMSNKDLFYRAVRLFGGAVFVTDNCIYYDYENK